MSGQRLDDRSRAAQPDVQSDENAPRSRADEAVDELLSKDAVDLRRPARLTLPSVEPPSTTRYSTFA